MDTKKTTVTLLDKTQFVMETIYVEWQISRTDGPVPTPAEVRQRILEERDLRTKDWASKCEHPGDSEVFGPVPAGPFEAEVLKVALDCISMKVPIAETVGFVFGIDHMPIALREQWVRHRIGHKFNGDFGFEQVPNQHDSSFWSQTFRAKDMGRFATDGEFYQPEWLELNGDRLMPGHGRPYCPSCGEEAIYLPGNPGMYQCEKSHPTFRVDSRFTIRHFYNEQHMWMQAAYRRMVDSGMPLEDARNILPLSCQHRMTWSTNLSALIHILSKRGCWIAQLGMWEPVVRGIVDELATKVHPFFRKLVDPPCIGADDKFHECKFHKENDEYIRGTDPHHPCPLWLHNHGDRAERVVAEATMNSLGGMAASPPPTWGWNASPDTKTLVMDTKGRMWFPTRPHVCGTIQAEAQDFTARGRKYAQLWGRDPLTGERKVMSNA